MPNCCRCANVFPMLALVLAVVGLVETTHAQGRGFRGPPEAVRTRSGAYFVDAALPDAGDDVTASGRLAATVHVKNAAKDGDLSLLYLFDPEADEEKHQRFETTLLNHPSLNVALRAFKCGRINVTQGDAAAEYGKRAPLFAVFDAKGDCVGEVCMHGYKASSGPLLTLLNRAAKGHGKLGLPEFVKEYRSFLNDLTQLEARKTALGSKKARLENQDGASRSKLAKLEKDEAELNKAEEKLMESEKKLLESAKIPPRDANATRVGERRWGGRR